MTTTLHPPQNVTTSPKPAVTNRDSRGEHSPPRHRLRFRWVLLFMLVLFAGIGYVTQGFWTARLAPWLITWRPSEARFEGLVLEQVKRGPFQITVTERGTLDSLRNAILTSKVEGTTTIIYIVKEGEHVQAGDLVVELDASALIDKETQQQIAVTNAKSQLDTALENLEIQKQQNASDISAAELKLTLAQLDLENYEKPNGDFEQQRRELESQLTLAKDKLAQARELEEYYERLVKKGFKTQNELNAMRISRRAEEINVEVVQNKLKLLQEATYKRTITELRANAEEYARDLQRAQAKAKAALAQKEAELEAKRLAYQIELNRLKRLQEQIQACKIYAPQDGQVIYANQRDGRSDQVLIEEGAVVRERQPIVMLPDLTAMKVNARVHESRISMIREGLPVRVKVDAYPDEIYSGVVDSVASVPSSTGSSFMRDIKEYEATVRILDEEEKVSKLRPGLTAQMEVLVESREDVLQTPIQSVVSIAGKQFVFVVEGPKVTHREVHVGKSNERFVEVLEGLVEGDQVVMNPRSQFEREIKELEAQLIRQQQQEQAQALVPSPSMPLSASGREKEKTTTESPATSSPTLAPPRDARQPPPGSEERPRTFDPQAFFQRFDADGDGKIPLAELPERMRERFAMIDKDADGFVTLEELQLTRPSVAGGSPPRTPADVRSE